MALPYLETPLGLYETSSFHHLNPEKSWNGIHVIQLTPPTAWYEHIGKLPNTAWSYILQIQPLSPMLPPRASVNMRNYQFRTAYTRNTASPNT